MKNLARNFCGLLAGLLVLLAVLAFSAKAQAENLILNGGFENDLSNWDPYQYPSGWTTSTTNPHSGQKCAVFTFPHGTGYYDASMRTSNYEIYVVPDVLYRFSFWTREKDTHDTNNDTVSILDAVVLLNGSYAFHPHNLPSSESWQQWEVISQFEDSGYVTVELQLHGYATSESAEFAVDDVILGWICGDADTIIVGNPNIEPSCMEAKLPIYLANQEPVSAGHVILDYSDAGWPFHPSDVSFAGTRVESWGFKPVVIDSTAMTIDIGFFYDGENPLDPADEITRDIPIAKIMFDECEFAGTMWLQPPDTTTLCAELDCFSTSLVDTFGVLYSPDIEFDSTQASGYVPGDCDGSGNVDIDDVVYLINYIFAGGPAPVCNGNTGDANGSCNRDIDDVVYLINYIFGGGPAPVPYCSNPQAFGKTVVGGASLSIADNASDETSAISLSADRDVQAVQLEFVDNGNVGDIRIESLVDGIEVFYGHVDGVFRVGLVDLYGTQMIPSGETDIVSITYDGDGKLELTNSIIVAKGGGHLDASVSRQTVDAIKPSDFALYQNQPNPFNPTTEISLYLPVTSNVRLDVYNIMGQKVTTLVDGPMQPGPHSVTWNGMSDSGEPVASGIYFYRLEAGNYSESRKMLLLK